MPNNVQDLDEGQLELFLRCLNMKYPWRLQYFTNAFHSRKSAMFVFQKKKPVLSLARPHFQLGQSKRLGSGLAASLPGSLMKMEGDGDKDNGNGRWWKWRIVGMEDDGVGRWSRLIKDDEGGRCWRWKMTKMDDDTNGRWWKMEDNGDGRWWGWKMTEIEDDEDGRW